MLYEPPSARSLAGEAVAALQAGDAERAATLAGAAAEAFESEQGNPCFEAPNLLRLRAEALLAMEDRAGAAATLRRATALAAELPVNVVCDRLRATLRRLMATEQTLILVKPDAFARGLTGEIIARFERKGLTIRELRKLQLDEGTAKQHYAEHEGKPFFGELVDFITSGPLVAMVLEGDDAIRAARQVIGATNPLEAATGSIRGDFAIAVGTNMVHGSDSPESGQRESKLFFPDA